MKSASVHVPIPVGASLVVTARVVKRRRRIFEARAEIRIDGSGDTLLAEAAAIMFAVGSKSGEAET